MRDFINLFEGESNEFVMPPALTVKAFLVSFVVHMYKQESGSKKGVFKEKLEKILKTIGITKQQFSEELHKPKPWFAGNKNPVEAFQRYFQYHQAEKQEWLHKNATGLLSSIEALIKKIEAYHNSSEDWARLSEKMKAKYSVFMKDTKNSLRRFLTVYNNSKDWNSLSKDSKENFLSNMGNNESSFKLILIGKMFNNLISLLHQVVNNLSYFVVMVATGAVFHFASM